MPQTETAQDVPNANVASLKAINEAQGGTVVVVDNGDGTSNVTTTWPDAPSGGGGSGT